MHGYTKGPGLKKRTRQRVSSRITACSLPTDHFQTSKRQVDLIYRSLRAPSDDVIDSRLERNTKKRPTAPTRYLPFGDINQRRLGRYFFPYWTRHGSARRANDHFSLVFRPILSHQHTQRISGAVGKSSKRGWRGWKGYPKSRVWRV